MVNFNTKLVKLIAFILDTLEIFERNLKNKSRYVGNA